MEIYRIGNDHTNTVEASGPEKIKSNNSVVNGARVYVKVLGPQLYKEVGVQRIPIPRTETWNPVGWMRPQKRGSVTWYVFSSK